jgi:hypothetical protein
MLCVKGPSFYILLHITISPSNMVKLYDPLGATLAICLVVSSHFWVGNNFSKSMDFADRNGSICSMFTVTLMQPLLSRESIWACLPSKVGCQPTRLFIFRVFSAKFSEGGQSLWAIPICYAFTARVAWTSKKSNMLRTPRVSVVVSCRETTPAAVSQCQEGLFSKSDKHVPNSFPNSFPTKCCPIGRVMLLVYKPHIDISYINRLNPVFETKATWPTLRCPWRDMDFGSSCGPIQ